VKEIGVLEGKKGGSSSIFYYCAGHYNGRKRKERHFHFREVLQFEELTK
jgi:hypothetical protein